MFLIDNSDVHCHHHHRFHMSSKTTKKIYPSQEYKALLFICLLSGIITPVIYSRSLRFGNKKKHSITKLFLIVKKNLLFVILPSWANVCVGDCVCACHITHECWDLSDARGRGIFPLAVQMSTRKNIYTTSVYCWNGICMMETDAEKTIEYNSLEMIHDSSRAELALPTVYLRFFRFCRNFPGTDACYIFHKLRTSQLLRPYFSNKLLLRQK